MLERVSQSLRFKIGLLLVLCAMFVEATFACTVTITSLRKEFRQSKRVFIGEVLTVEGIKKDKLPRQLAEDWNSLDKITFRVKQAWKGEANGTADVYSNVWCNCPNKLLKFEPGKQFIIYADENSFVDACSLRVSDVSDVRMKDERKQDMARLDSFWFRTWARIYRF